MERLGQQLIVLLEQQDIIGGARNSNGSYVTAGGGYSSNDAGYGTLVKTYDGTSWSEGNNLITC